MDNDKKYTTTLRLYKDRPVHAQAYRCLKNYNTDIFRTKDDYIAEAVVHFSQYLKQEEEDRRMEELNSYLSRQNGPLLELVKEAVAQMQREQLPGIIKETVKEVLQGIPTAASGDKPSDKEAEEKEYSQRDIQFAQFYNFDDD